MVDYVLISVFALISLMFYGAERALSLFTWSRLEEVDVPRPRRQATAHCLEEHELVTVSFLTVGSLAAAGLIVALVRKVGFELPGLAYSLAVILLLVWLVPELLAWRFRDSIALYAAPALFGIIGVPFRFVRSIFVPQAVAQEGDVLLPPEEGVSENGEPDAEAHEMFREAVRLKHTQLREIMTPRTDMISVSEKSTLRAVAKTCMESGYSRLPVHRSNRDQIVGVLHVKELLPFAATDRWDKPALPEIMRPPVFVPETKVVSEFLEEVLKSHVHMAIVLDEYGGTRGLVTLEDILEELVGEIRDEYESPREEVPLFRRRDARSVDVQAVMRVEDFNEEFETDLPEEEDFDTIGGFVTFIMGKIPIAGESFQAGAAKLTVMEADPRHVIQVRVDFEQPRRRE
jgi:magnesium and cobalt transporter